MKLTCNILSPRLLYFPSFQDTKQNGSRRNFGIHERLEGSFLLLKTLLNLFKTFQGKCLSRLDLCVSLYWVRIHIIVMFQKVCFIVLLLLRIYYSLVQNIICHEILPYLLQYNFI